jgi:hypothetical protein
MTPHHINSTQGCNYPLDTPNTPSEIEVQTEG